MALLPLTPASAYLLLIEPDAGLQAFLEVVLRDEGYRLRVVSSVEEAMALVNVQTFDLVLADFSNESIPKRLQALKPLQERVQPIKLGMIIGAGDASEEEEEELLDCAFTLPKPIAPEQLLAEVAICLHQPPTLEQKRQAQVVEQFFEALRLKEIRKLLNLCAEDIELYPSKISPALLRQVVTGKVALGGYAEALRSSYQRLRLDVQHIFSRPRGLVVQYTMAVEADRNWQLIGGSLLIQFAGDRIRQIGLRREKN